ncbi:MAG: DNA-directed RNA polymerase subunit beta [Candidatus Jacksonbacteria bacterium RIFOXYC2_FULL_44_29]|nr:MAG: DNA-directed RNA polymerase subunit beta [Candidatus Jacksonbacteria bacterium RIFOXYA2_FULL_43_12]OGY75425.1 MAG: DNA-directed RNA polymerase subunit beta [Candidatus Jacksonbacteria bacterium RIFOXYB2_FULL_44_15]OGY77509.1 MAG: DNA-directed RNA polymerase subunit beta [Candidatus Jacksonbacteria bacterium RIFOXYC2_FULL_44_29]OGY79890.1 MAG: DNA-directed RNA polymerase subunit beta [Candidatus Jacksonbacteria bacterium RIFOXYD2_FULL_43_21]HBH46175.1 DNA-directed RNA polymerase subunit 
MIKRKFFTLQHEVEPLPDLIEIQKNAYAWFFKDGLKELFEEFSPIQDFIGRDLELWFQDYYLDEPKFSEEVARNKNLTYDAALRVKTKLVNKKTNEVKEQEIFLGEFPLMTDNGTFVINGIERVVVSQVIRSAGIFFTFEKRKTRNFYGAKIIPNRGAWLEIETSPKNVIWVKIDRKRKVAITSLLRAFGCGNGEELKEIFKDVDNDPENRFIEATLEKDNAKDQSEGLIEVYKRIRPGDLATPDNAKSLIFSMFFDFDRYDFGRVGRYKINRRLGLDVPLDKEYRILLRDDLIAIIKEIIRLNNSQEVADDIDHLGNRRVRTVGELLQNRVRVGMARMERIIRDRMSTYELHGLTPAQLINSRPVSGVVREFFMSSALAQFMDQTNPLAELEHKRRISAMGPGGLSRDRAGFEVRDVHRTHYGRICPIATPEGPNIGLVGHLACYARVNEFGFLETPYRRVINKVKNDGQSGIGEIVRLDIKSDHGEVIVAEDTKITREVASRLKKESTQEFIPVRPRVTSEIVYLDAFAEEKKGIVPATTKINEQGYFIDKKVEMRLRGEPSFDYAWKIDFVDTSPKQIVSISTSLIPFLEHNDAVRALMGTNMQRQAVPCIRPQAPIVGTGVEGAAAYNSGHVTIAKEAGEVTELSAERIVIKDKDGEKQEYKLVKFKRSNASTCLNQRPIISLGDKIKKGQVVADGAAVDNGELALGKNILMAFMPWEGWNFEDAVIISERLVENDTFTSIHIKEYSIDVRETKLGSEQVTRDIPNVSEERLKDLDEDGIIRMGAEVESGDILVGKITPKGETELSAEEKLLRAIFGEKAKDVRDSSLYLEHGEKGKVVDVKIFSRAGGDKLAAGVIKTIQVTIANLRKIQVGDKMAGRHGNKGVISKILPVEDMPCMADGTPMEVILNPLGVASRMNLGQVLETHLGLAARAFNYKVATPVFDGVPEKMIADELERAGLPRDGKLQLFDGRTGEPFDQKTTVGVMYMMKLNHLVDDKIHQRSIGPYSLVTQQPLGGKVRFGGQRFGEMEVWALEAYGAAHTLQEMLTIKSDDVPGRSKAYEAIIKGKPVDKVNIPESFNVLLRELKGLGLNVQLLKNGQQVKEEIVIDHEHEPEDKNN